MMPTTRTRWCLILLGLSLLALGCGRGPTTPDRAGEFGPTSAAAIPDYRTSTPAAPMVLDDPYYRMMVMVGPGGRAKRWQGGLMRHCAINGFPEDVMERMAEEITHLTGIGRKSGGDCNVTWSINLALGPKYAGITSIPVMDAGPDWAKVEFNSEYSVKVAEHEMGHVIGLLHSDRQVDLMYGGADSKQDKHFSPAELGVIRWLYGR